MWVLVGDAKEFKCMEECQEVLILLCTQLPDGMSPRPVADAHDKDDHTTSSLLRKMEDAGAIRHSNNQYFALVDTIPVISVINRGQHYDQDMLLTR
jgi:hypothetical protein